MTTFVSLAAHLERTIEAELPHLRAIPDGPRTAAPNRPSGAGWSQREELGPLYGHVRAKKYLGSTLPGDEELGSLLADAEALALEQLLGSGSQ